MTANAAEVSDFADLGATSFIISSDQGLMRRAASQTITDFKKLTTTLGKSHVS
jgi:2-keto-3-deoxy-L-rhamnonate aldolase RhmA